MGGKTDSPPPPHTHKGLAKVGNKQQASGSQCCFCSTHQQTDKTSIHFKIQFIAFKPGNSSNDHRQ